MGVFIVALVIVVFEYDIACQKEDYAHHSVFYAKFDPLVHWLSSMMPSFIKQASFFDKEAAAPKEATEQQVFKS